MYFKYIVLVQYLLCPLSRSAPSHPIRVFILPLVLAQKNIYCVLLSIKLFSVIECCRSHTSILSYFILLFCSSLTFFFYWSAELFFLFSYFYYIDIRVVHYNIHFTTVIYVKKSFEEKKLFYFILFYFIYYCGCCSNGLRGAISI